MCFLPLHEYTFDSESSHRSNDVPPDGRKGNRNEKVLDYRSGCMLAVSGRMWFSCGNKYSIKRTGRSDHVNSYEQQSTDRLSRPSSATGPVQPGHSSSKRADLCRSRRPEHCSAGGKDDHQTSLAPCSEASGSESVPDYSMSEFNVGIGMTG